MAKEKRARQKAGRQQRLEEQKKEAAAKRRRQAAVRFGIIGGIVVVALAIFWLMNRGDDDGGETAADATAEADAESDGTATLSAVPDPPGAGESITGETPCPEADDSSPRTTSFEEPPPLCIDPALEYVAVLDTTLGEIRVTLDTENALDTVNNFVVLSRYHYYDDTAIYRTDPLTGIVQGGAPLTNSTDDAGPGYANPDEGQGFVYEPGQLVMASEPGQFLLTAIEDAPGLSPEGRLPVFGSTDADGLAVVESILELHDPESAGLLGGEPSEPVVVNSVTIEEQ